MFGVSARRRRPRRRRTSTTLSFSLKRGEKRKAELKILQICVTRIHVAEAFILLQSRLSNSVYYSNCSSSVSGSRATRGPVASRSAPRKSPDNNKCKIIHKEDCARNEPRRIAAAIQSEMVIVEVINASSLALHGRPTKMANSRCY